MLGDSYAEALQVELEETFWWLLAQRLQGCASQPGKRIEAVNFGVSGYGTAQQVLLAFFPGNDVRNNSLALEGEKRQDLARVLLGGQHLERLWWRPLSAWYLPIASRIWKRFSWRTASQRYGRARTGRAAL